MKFAALGLVAIGAIAPLPLQAHDCPMVFKCGSLERGTTFLVTLDPSTGRVLVDTGGNTFQFEQELVYQQSAQQGWRRWRTNSDRNGRANSWTELNIHTGAMKDIDYTGRVIPYPQGHCKMRTR